MTDKEILKENVLNIWNELEEMSKKYPYSEMETAIYLWARYGDDTLDLTKDMIEKINNTIREIDGSLYNEYLNETAEEIIGY